MLLGLFFAVLAALPARALDLASPSASLPGALHASPLATWPADAALKAPERASLAPVLRALELRGMTPASFATLTQELKAQARAQAEADVRAEAQVEAKRLIEEAAAADPSSPAYAVLAARLAQLSGPLAEYAPKEARASLLLMSRTVASQLADDKRLVLQMRMELMARALESARPERETAVEAAAARLARVPAELMTPGVARLRAALAAPSRALLRPAPPGLAVKIELARAGYGAKALLARRIYRPVLTFGQRVLVEFGALWRAYVSMTDPDRHPYRWSVLRGLHKKGDFSGAFGHKTYKDDPKILSTLVGDDDRPAALAAQQKKLRGATLTPSLGISGMSFPQLTAQSHLALLYIDLKLAREQGVRLLHNTGEGSPHLLLGLLEGDAAKTQAGVIEWIRANDKIKDGTWDEARVLALVESLMSKRAELLGDFSKEDLERAQIVAQFGGGLNGIRRDDDEGRVDFDKLRAVAGSPYVAMVQYKLKQAAKRGAKVDAKKMDLLSLSFRELDPARKFKSPEVIADMSDARAIAALVKATRAVTDKPVSLKFGIGDVKDLYEVLEYLRDARALPDHIQVDGAGKEYSPGSGNAPPEADTSLPADQAVIALDAILKKLGARERVFVDVSGDVLWPVDAVHKLALGADGVCAARGWMGMGLGCSMAKKCDGADGQCPWGIASAGHSLPGLSLDAAAVGARGYKAAANWHKEYAKMLSEAGVEDAWKARSVLGLSNPLSPVHILDADGFARPLDRVYTRERVIDTLRGALTPQEVDRYVFGR
jgi:glutamate synthase domain-containing protein 2